MNAKILRWSKTHTIIVAILAITFAMVFVLWRNVQHSVAITVPQCASNAVTIGGIPTNTVSGNLPIYVGVSASSGSNLTATGVNLSASTVGFVGNAVIASNTANGSNWQLPLVTSFLANGPHPIYASVYFSNGSSCNTATLPLNVYNPTAPTNLLVNLSPANFSSGTNTAFSYNAAVYAQGSTALNISQYAGYSWETSVGSIQAEGPGKARLFTGPSSANGTTTLTVKYAGRIVKSTGAFIVTATGANTSTSSSPTGSTTTTTTTTTNPTSTKETTTTTTNPLPASLATSTESQSKLAATVQDCASTAIGAERALAIKTGQSRPTVEESEKLKVCFALTNYIVPSAFAPVAPKELTSLPQSTVAKVTALTNGTTTTQAGKNKQTLKISGTAKPNTTVYLYVFSEPLVITTTADATGNWVYTLEDPLEPGKHEVYAAVDKGDGKYEKSNPFSFAIGKAEASAENPAGLGLRIESGATPAQSNRILYWYIACVVFVLAMAGAVLATIIHHHKTKNTPPTPPTPPNYTTPPTSFTPTPPSNGFAG